MNRVHSAFGSIPSEGGRNSECSVERAARLIRDAIGHFRCDHGMARIAAQALAEAGLLELANPPEEGQ